MGEAKKVTVEELEEEVGENETLVLFKVDGHQDFMDRVMNEADTFRPPYHPYALTPNKHRDEIDDEEILIFLTELKDCLDKFDVAYETQVLGYGIYDLEEEGFNRLVMSEKAMEEIIDKQAEKDMWQSILSRLWWVDKQFGHRFGFNIPFARRYHTWLRKLDYEHGPYIGENRVCGYCGENSVDQYRTNPDRPLPEEQYKMSVAVCDECDDWITESIQKIHSEYMEGKFDGDL